MKTLTKLYEIVQQDMQAHNKRPFVERNETTITVGCSCAFGEWRVIERARALLLAEYLEEGRDFTFSFGWITVFNNEGRAVQSSRRLYVTVPRKRPEGALQMKRAMLAIDEL